jgi:CheY-like chemotaxis protein
LGPQRTQGLYQEMSVRAASSLGSASRGRALAVSSANGFASLVVLVVEDEFLIRCAIVQYLRDAGCTVLEACSADQALAMCQDGRTVDVLLTDINLSDAAGGWDVAEALRCSRPGIGVVYVSGNAVDQSRRVADSLFLHKPYLPTEILQACRDVAETSC